MPAKKQVFLRSGYNRAFTLTSQHQKYLSQMNSSKTLRCAKEANQLLEEISQLINQMTSVKNKKYCFLLCGLLVVSSQFLLLDLN